MDAHRSHDLTVCTCSSVFLTYGRAVNMLQVTRHL